MKTPRQMKLPKHELRMKKSYKKKYEKPKLMQKH